MPTTHEYPVNVVWTGGRDGRGTVRSQHSGTETEIAVPPEFQGPGGAASPEELLTSAIASCYTITFGIIAANRKIPVKEIHVDAVGEIEQNGPSFTYKAITVRPRIALQSDATEDQVGLANDMAMKADHYCIITNAVRDKVEIKVEPTISKG